jgi:seryl-tRNA synthetase
VRAALLKRVDNADLVAILEADALRRKLTTEVDEARSAPNWQAKEIGKLKASGADTAEARKRAAMLGDQVTAMQAALTAGDKTLNDLLIELPNLPDDRSPVGGKEANQVVHTWGRQPNLADKPLDHVELSSRLGLVDYARGAKLAGSGYWLHTGQGSDLPSRATTGGTIAASQAVQGGSRP